MYDKIHYKLKKKILFIVFCPHLKTVGFNEFSYIEININHYFSFSQKDGELNDIIIFTSFYCKESEVDPFPPNRLFSKFLCKWKT